MLLGSQVLDVGDMKVASQSVDQGNDLAEKDVAAETEESMGDVSKELCEGERSALTDEEEDTKTDYDEENWNAKIVKQKPFAPLITPLRANERPQERQIALRVNTFRRRDGIREGLSDRYVRELLQREGWDLEAAIESFQKNALPNAIKDHESNTPGRSQQRQDRDYILASQSRHENHRRTIDVTYRRISTHFSSQEPTAFRVANLLREAYWVIEDAIKKYEEQSKSPTSQAQVDRFESRLRGILPPNATLPTQVHRDESLKVFLEIAGTDDWVSARIFLEKHNWDTVLAVEKWMQGGFPCLPPTLLEQRRSGYRAPVELHFEINDLWPAGRSLTGAITGIDQADLDDAALDYREGKYARQHSWYIEIDPNTAQAGVASLHKLKTFCIQHGRGTVRDFVGPKKKGTGTNGVPAVKEERDWFNSHHITFLNVAMSQGPARGGGVVKRVIKRRVLKPKDRSADNTANANEEIVDEGAKTSAVLEEEGGMKIDTDQ